MNGGHIYSASDRSIYDALNQSKVIKDALQELFLRRGIIISRETPREEIAKYFSRIQHDFHDYQRLSELLGSISRKEQLSTQYVKNDISISNVSTLVNTIDANSLDVGLDVTAASGGKSLHIHVSYTMTHFSKSEFRQVVEKDALIEIEKHGTGVLIRSPSNKKTHEVINNLFNKIESNLEQDVEIEVISLASVTDASKRRQFFEKLMSQMEGYELTEVVDAFVFNPLSKKDTEYDTEDVDIGTRISKAALKGENVLGSKELGSFLDSGFCIYKVVWQAVKSEERSDLYEFEAQFKKTDTLDDFNYIVKGAYRAKEHEEDSMKPYSDSRHSLGRYEETLINRLIEQSALKSMKSVHQVHEDILDAEDKVDQR